MSAHLNSKKKATVTSFQKQENDLLESLAAVASIFIIIRHRLLLKREKEKGISEIVTQQLEVLSVHNNARASNV